MRLPDRRISVAVLCNAAGAPATSFARQMAAALLAAAPEPAQESPTDTVAPDTREVARIAGVYRSSRTHEPVYVGVGQGRGGRGGTAIVRRRDGTWQVGNSRAVIELGSSGPPTRFLQLAADNDTIPLVYVSATPWSPPVADLSAFAGQYRSEEVGATWTASVDSGRLVLRVRPGDRRILTPAYTDAFSGGGLGTVWFTRDAGGRVDAMHRSSGRLWNLALPRVR
jgi:hypothetical protein